MGCAAEHGSSLPRDSHLLRHTRGGPDDPDTRTRMWRFSRHACCCRMAATSSIRSSTRTPGNGIRSLDTAVNRRGPASSSNLRIPRRTGGQMTAPANGPANAAQAPDSGVGRGYVKVPGIIVVTVLILATLMLTIYCLVVVWPAGGSATAVTSSRLLGVRLRLDGDQRLFTVVALAGFLGGLIKRPFALLVRRQPEPAAQLAGDVRFAALRRQRAGDRVLRRAARRPGGGADHGGPAERVRFRGRLGAGRIVLPGGG